MGIKLLLLACISSSYVFSQAYVPIFATDKEWKVRYYDSIRVIKVLGDTLVNGMTYNVLNSLNRGPNLGDDHIVHSYVREDSAAKKCWLLNKNKTSERILYDFNLKANDTCTFTNLKIPNSPQTYFTADSVCIGDCNTIFCSHDWINSVTILSNLHMYYFTGNSFVTNFQYIDGVGSIFGPVYLDELVGCGGNFGGGCVTSTCELICCKKGTQVLYIKDCYLNCDSPKNYSNGIDPEKSIKYKLLIRPNPANSEIEISNPFDEELNIKFINNIGEVVLEKTISRYERLNLNTVNFARGIYYIKFDNLEAQKLILE
jgi:hypothetical protein